MTSLGKILIIDDEEDMLESCSRILKRLGYETLTEKDPLKALELLERERPDLVLTDLRMPGLNGLEVLKAAKRLDPESVVIFLTAYATIETAVEAMKEGAFDYIPKPFSAEQLRVSIERAFRQKGLLEENRRLREQLEKTYSFENLVGRSLPMLQVFETVKKVAGSEANILILGESGTGKELIARSIHANSKRAGRAFIPVDCASLPETLLESELFGHEKGAFTGAHATRPGLFEFAHGGTIFLDEVGDLSLNLQAKLLRVLQERQVRRVGSNRLIDIDVRVISATHYDLAQTVARGKFREDLYYRLNVISIKLPPLRERKGDIPLLVHHYLKKYSLASGKEVRGVSPKAMELLEQYHWPGNVRELQNVIERAVVLAEGEFITHHDLPEPIKAGGPPASVVPLGELSLKQAKDEKIQAFEREYLQELLRRHGGNISQAAKAAGVDRKTIHRLLKKHGLRAGQ